MGDVVDTVSKPFKEIGDEIGKGVKGVGDFGQDVIDTTIKPIRDVSQASVEATTGAVRGIGRLAEQNPGAVAGAGLSAFTGMPIGLGNFTQRKQQATNVQSSDPNKPQQRQTKVSSVPPIQGGGGMSPVVMASIVGGAILLVVFLMRGKK